MAPGLTGTVQVSREDLESGSSDDGRGDSDPSSAVETRIQHHFQLTFGDRGEDLLDTSADVRKGNADDNVEHEDDDGFEFRLFTDPVKHQPTLSSVSVQRVILRSPSPINREPGFLIPRRPDGYYFTGPTNAQRLAEFKAAALEGHEVLAGSKTKWLGAELSWKVTVVKAWRSPSSPTASVAQAYEIAKCKRHGKKRRIAIRKKNQLEESKRAALKEAQNQKEIADRDKRTRRNREKKVKRKQKEKERKTQDLQDVG